MTGITDPCHPETVRVAASHQAEARQIAAELAAIAATGMILPGSITQRRTRCAGPAAPAGPTRPACTARTGSGPARSPPEPSAAGSAPPSARTTRPGSTTTGGSASYSPGSKPSAPPPSKPTPAGSASPEPHTPAPGRSPHNTVAAARLTCGQPRDQPPFPQVTAKCEDLTEQVRRSAAIYRRYCRSLGSALLAVVRHRCVVPPSPGLHDPGVRAWCQVSIALCRREALVPEERLDVVQGHAILDQPARRRMPHDPRRESADPADVDGRIPDAVTEVAVIDWAACWRGEHQGIPDPAGHERRH